MTDRMDAADQATRNESDDARPVTDGSAATDDPTDGARMRDVSHTPPHGAGTNGVWTRGDGDDYDDE
ncbi:MAG: hypothetical protein ABEJ73_09335 [Haloplanus sp.]